MAGDWIKMRKSLPTDPRIVRISSALNADRLRTLGGVLSAWCLLDEHTEDGHLCGYTAESFDEIVGVRGLCQAMADVGWMVISPQGLTATNFTEHNGATAKRRAQESVRKMSARDADKKRPREEKIREEKNTHTHTQQNRNSISVPEEIKDHWQRWCEWRFSITGREVDPIQAETVLMDLGLRGWDKAKRDIDFSIRKDAKTILDSDNDFELRKPAHQSSNRGFTT